MDDTALKAPDTSPRLRGKMRCGDATFHWGERTYIMGVVNVTPDSFSGDGLAGRPKEAIELALRLEAEGADIIDIGAESTRPPGAVYGQGAPPITPQEELRRVLPVLRGLAGRLKVPISIDTYKAEVARCAIGEGASMINDVWGLNAEPDLAGVASEYHVPLVLMHNQQTYHYRDLLSDVLASLQGSVSAALSAGVASSNLIVDPGIGFGKTADHNLELLRRLPEVCSLGYPLLVGTSRKATIGLILDLPADQRLEGTAATVALCIVGGADIVRVHDVREMSRVVKMSDAVVRGWRPVSWPQ